MSGRPTLWLALLAGGLAGCDEPAAPAASAEPRGAAGAVHASGESAGPDVSATGSAGPGAARRETLAFERLPRLAVRAGEIPPMRVLWRSAAELAAFWNRYGTGPAPAIDFDRASVAAVFLGPKPNSGYAVRIDQVTRVGDELHIHFVEWLPDPERDYAAVITHPLDVVRIPAVAETASFTSRRQAGEPRPD